MKFEQLEFPILLTPTTQEEIGKARDHYALTSDEVTQAALVALGILIPAWRLGNIGLGDEAAAKILLDVSQGFRKGGAFEKIAWDTMRTIWGFIGSVGKVG